MKPLLSRPGIWVALKLTLLLVVCACSSKGFGVSSTADPLTRFPSKATFTWDSARSKAPTDPRLAKLELERNVREQAEAALAARGYRMIAKGEPDYRLIYQLNVRQVVGGDFTRAIGSLWLTLRERATDHAVWTGAVETDVQVGLSPDERRARIREMLELLFKDFPPTQRSD